MTTPDELARAGNYVLGLMEEEERVKFERDMATDPALRSAVVRFAEQMHALDELQTSEPVPEGLWRRIEGIIARTSQDRPNVMSARNGLKIGAGGNRSWRIAAMAASIAIALGVGYFAGRMTALMPQPVVLVVLQTPENSPGAVFEAFADNSVRVVPLEDFVVPEGKVMQVWTLYDKEVGPVSLGTLARAEVTMLGARDFPPPKVEQLYEITLEPLPGSPTGKPTGPILVKGLAKRLAGE